MRCDSIGIAFRNFSMLFSSSFARHFTPSNKNEMGKDRRVKKKFEEQPPTRSMKQTESTFISYLLDFKTFER